MNRIFFCLILFLLPAAAFSQQATLQEEMVSSVVISDYMVTDERIPNPPASTSESSESEIPESENSDPHSYHLVEPILMRTLDYNTMDNGAFRLGQSPEAAFFSSLLIPGSGQLASRSWLRAGLFIAIEAAGVYLAVDQRNKAVAGEREYERFADNNWSVVGYSNWLIDYHEIHGINNPYIDQLRTEVANTEAAYDTRVDWQKVDINLLRNVERNTPYLTTDDEIANQFSHTMPSYGSQQYYELIAKYYQYQAGWRDYHAHHDAIGHTGPDFENRFLIDRNGAYASTYFYDAADAANIFNADYRRSRTIATFLLVNHVISAFDTYFTVKLKQNNLQASSSVSPGRQFVLSYHF